MRNKAGGRPIPGYSKNKKGKKVTDKKIKQLLMNLINNDDEATYGYRKLTRCLQRKHKLIINKKKVYRLCKELEILLPQREKKNKVSRKLARNHTVDGPNQLWQMDIKYGYVTSSRRFIFLASIIDVFDRAIVGYHYGTRCTAKDIVRTLHKAIMKRNVQLLPNQKLVLRTDNGPQFCSHELSDFCMAQGIFHERIPPKTPNMNAFIESFHSVLERDCFSRHEFVTFQDAYQEIDRYMKFYNERRLHGSLEDWPPKKFLELWEAGKINPKQIAV